MFSVSALKSCRRLLLKFQAIPRPILNTTCQNKTHLQALVRQASTKFSSSFLPRARFEIGYYSYLLVYMLCLTLASETIDWILVDPLTSAYYKSVTHKSKDSSTSYQYGILRKGYIRLFSIKPGVGDDSIEMEMKHVKFIPWAIYRDFLPLYPNVPKYEALSYAWGETDENDAVYVIFLVCFIILFIIYIS